MECPKILKICQITKPYMGFQKKNMTGRSEKVDFFESCGFLRQCLLKAENTRVFLNAIEKCVSSAFLAV